MTDDKRERISALLDDEVPTRDIAETIRQLQEEDSLTETWQRYQLIGDLMRGEVPAGSAGGVVDRVRAEMESEPAVIAFPQRKNVRPRSRKHWPRHFAGGMLAASVAALSVILLPRLTISTLDEPDLVQVTPKSSISTLDESNPVQVTSNPSMPPVVVKQTGTYWENLPMKQVESKLNRYLIEHNEFASPGGMKGVLPYTSFVAYDQK